MGRRETGGRQGPAARVAFMGMLFALAMVLSFVESMLPALPMLPPGVKLGLSNIVTMYCLFFLGAREAFTLALLKSLFVFLTRGAVAAAMSLTGGLTSVLVMLLFLKIPKLDLSYLVLSVLGAISHNLGQLLMAAFIIQSGFVAYYLPIMVLSGVLMGVLTGVILRVLAPYMNRLGLSPRRGTQNPQ